MPKSPAELHAAWRAMQPERRSHAKGLALAIGTLNALGFFLLLAPGGALGAGLGLTAYALGVRHAFDADHIAAIDNATRKLTAEGRESLAVGFWFSLGHSTVVFSIGALVALGAGGVGPALADGGTTLGLVTGTWGPAVAGCFLLAIAALNFDGLRHPGRTPRGAFSRFCARALRPVSSARRMYPVGLMFGLGFDTASEIALLMLAAGGAASGLPFYVVLCLPILFTAGMTLFDTLNSVFMSAAYRQSPSGSSYNRVVTGLSVVVALVVGTLTLATIELPYAEYAGYAIVAVFAIVWTAALATRRRAVDSYDQRSCAAPSPASP